MTRLLGFIDKDRQTEALADKFTNRFAEAALASTPKPARDVAFCLSQLALGDKAFRKFMEQWKLYEPALYDKEVYSALCGVVAKAKKSYGSKSKSADGGDAARVQVEEFEAKMHAAHVERYESWRAQRRAELAVGRGAWGAVAPWRTLRLFSATAAIFPLARSSAAKKLMCSARV